MKMLTQVRAYPCSSFPNVGLRFFHYGTFIALLFLVNIPAGAQKKEWKMAKQIHTIEAYKDFANRFPTSKYTVQARDSACALSFRNARQLNTIVAYRQFALECRRPAVEPFLCELYFEKAKSANTVSEYRYYLNQCPKAKNAADARESLLGLQFGAAKEAGNPAAVQAFFSECKECRYADMAKRMLDSLQWLDAVREDRLFSYYLYIVSAEINTIPGFYKDLASKRFLERLNAPLTARDIENSNYVTGPVVIPAKILTYEEVEAQVNAAIAPLTLEQVKTPGEISQPRYGTTSRYIPGRGVVNQRAYNGTTMVQMTDGYSSHTEKSDEKSISIDRYVSASVVKNAFVTIKKEKEYGASQTVIFKYFDNRDKQNPLAAMDLRLQKGNDLQLFLRIQGRWYTFSKDQ